MLATNPFFSDLAAALDPVDFAQSLGIDPDPWQEDILRSDSNRIILNCARQTGKSSVVAIIALHHALYHPKAMVIIISHTLQQAAETFRKVHDYYRQIAKPVLSIIESVHRLELTNGSRIVTLTGQAPDSIRGFSNVSLLIIEEAAQVPREAYQAARPMSAVSDGRIILLSTPHGKENFFADAWFNESEWLKVEVNADQCPRLTARFIMEEKEICPRYWWLQEYYCHFAEAVDSVFRAEDIEAALNHPELPVRSEIDLSLDDL